MKSAPQQFGFWTCVALVVGNMIGGSIFLLPASLAPFGLNALPGWLLSCAGAVLLALVFSMLARAMPAAGGPYAYTRAAFGPFWAFVVMWGYWISIWVANAAIATAATSYLSALLPGLFAMRGVSTGFMLLLIWFFTLVSWWSIGAVGWVQSVTTVLKILPLVALCVFAPFFVTAQNVAAANTVPVTLGGSTAAAALVFFAMLGFESATIPDGKIRDPARTIPRATVLGTIVAAALSAGACTVVMLLIPGASLAGSNAPFADAARLIWGSAAGTVTILCSAVSAIGCLNGWTMLQGEVPFAMARNGVFPRRFAQVSARGTPTFALVVTSVLASLLILANAQKSLVSIFTFMILLSTTASLVIYGACALALLRLNSTGKLPGVPARLPRLAALGALASAFALWAMVGTGTEAVLWGAALLATGVPVYWLVRRRGTDTAHP